MANTKLIHGDEKAPNQSKTLPPLDDASCSASSFVGNVRKYDRSFVTPLETDSELMKQAKQAAFDTERSDVGNVYIKFLESQGIEWFTGKYVDGLVGMVVCSEHKDPK